MDAPRPILRVGLTGGIASGKTTVAGFLAELGAFVLDADRIAHAVIEPTGGAYGDVVARFGAGLLGPDGRIDRRALGRLVFEDASARHDLEAIVHPRVRAEIDRRVRRYALTGASPMAVIDAALLVESGSYRDYDRLVVVRCARDTQIRRILARGGLTPEEAVARIDAQATLGEKLEVADYVIDTDATLRETCRQTGRIHVALLSDFEKLYGEPWRGTGGDPS